jgi:hypothetical protein
MRAPALIAAGGIAAALGFYSANYDRLVQSPGTLGTFNEILFWLFLSLLVPLGMPALAYFSQIAYAHCLDNQKLSYDLPYVSDTRKSRIYRFLGDLCRWLGVACFLISVIFLVSGAGCSLHW